MKATARGPVIDRFGKQIALGALATFAAVMAGALVGRDPLSVFALIVLAVGILAFAVRLPR
jgi:hypothetical protein